MFRYQKETHAAAWTQDYVFQQLIPYIGNKRKLLGLIQQAIDATGIKPDAQHVFLDLFSGSGVVARMAKRLGFQVLANDWEPYSWEFNQCYITCNQAPTFDELGGYDNVMAYLNAVTPHADWVTQHLCPDHDHYFDPNRDRMFYTRQNGMRIDAMRQQIAEWDAAGWLSSIEKACLLAPLLYQASYTSNTSGVFKAFHKGWGGQTGTALYRILAEVQVKPALFYDNQCLNQVFRADAFQLVKDLADKKQSIDIAYLDPPYNQHPYGSNYHVLNSIALWDKPALTPKIQGRNKAAIRDDWRRERRSPYNYRGDAEHAFAHLLQQLNARFILTSYSTDGMIPLPALLAASMARGHTQVLCRPYKRYRVSSQRFSRKPLTVEFIMITDTQRSHFGISADAMAERIRKIESQALDQHPETAIYVTGSK